MEFGLSVYEPFGISQLEPLCFGAICVVSSVCGCLGLARRCAGGALPPNILEGDYVRARGGAKRPAGKLSRSDREAVEADEAKRIADELARRLPRSEADVARLLETGWQLGRHMGWEGVVAEYFLPAVRRACEQDELAGPA